MRVKNAGQANLRHGGARQGKYAAELLRHRPRATSIAWSRRTRFGGASTRPACTCRSSWRTSSPSQPDVYYVLAWNFKKEILANNRALLEQGVDFYFPVDAGAA